MTVSSWWEGTRLVAGRSLADGLRSRTVRITTLVLLLVGLAVVLVPRLLGGDEPTYTLASVGEPSAVIQSQLDAAGEAAGFNVEYLPVDDASAVESAVREGDATIGLAGTVMYVRTDAPGTVAVLVAQAVVAEERADLLREAGLTAAQIGEVSAVAVPEQIEVGPVQDEGRAAVGFIVGIVLYMAIMFSGNIIALNVGVEKSTRIAEVLLAVLRPSQILVGNVLGVGLQTLAQLLVLTTPILVAMTLTDGLDLPTVAAGDIALGMAWFVLGFLMYSFLFAATAALVDKVTEVGSAIMPVTVILVLAYLGAVVVVQQDPGSALSVALSMFPLTAPMAMPVRWSSGLVPEWQLAASMLLAVAAAVLLASFGSRVYRRALVITGRRLKLGEVLHPPPAATAHEFTQGSAGSLAR
jgi:ABC-2 type transport system permease protein